MGKAEALNQICQRHNIALVYLFGSYSEDAFSSLQGGNINIDDPLADLDIGLVFLKPLPSADQRRHLFGDIFLDFAELFRPYPVDLSFLEENHALFQLEAIKGRCIFSFDSRFRGNYEEMILRRAADFRPVLDLFLKESLEGF